MALHAQSPASGYVASAEAWAKLWQAYRGDEPVPAVDFRYELILVASGRDLNRITVCPEVNSWGNVRLSYQSTCLAFSKTTRFHYHFGTVYRGELRTVAGQPIAAD